MPTTFQKSMLTSISMPISKSTTNILVLVLLTFLVPSTDAYTLLPSSNTRRLPSTTIGSKNGRNTKRLSSSTTLNFTPPRRPNSSTIDNTHTRTLRRHAPTIPTNDPNTPPPPSPTSLQCQLLGMNCATPTDFTFSFKGFSLRGGLTDVHCHGWGIAFYEGRGLRVFHDPEPCSESPIAELVGSMELRTLNMMAHIRYATQGEVCLENVHPFQREMWGIQWCFAHNGDVPLFNQKHTDPKLLPKIGQHGPQIYNPVGDTDSEKIFCSILNALHAKFSTTLPSLPILHDYLSTLLQEIVEYEDENGDPCILNMLLGCGRHVQFAYSWPGARPGSNVWNGLHYTVREPPFRSAALSDCDYAVDFSECTDDTRDRVAVIATKPLTTNEEWVEVERGELILFDEGVPHGVAEDCYRSEMVGHGLESDVMGVEPKLEEDRRRFRLENSYFGSDI